MKPLQTPQVSVVVPAHNEEVHIADCINSLLKQTVEPLEIIIVDNCSTDKTAEIVSSFNSPLIRLIHEPVAGVRHARTTGFNEARGGVIARTDADSIVEPNWVEQILSNFSNGHVAAVSGPFYYYDMPIPEVSKSVEAWIRGELARFSKHSHFLAGANMAIRRDVWQSVRPFLCDDDTVHEDLDIAIHLQKRHYAIKFDPKLHVGTSARRLDDKLKAFYDYLRAYEHTYNSHGIHSVTLSVPIVAYFPLYPVMKVIRRAYNPVTRRLSVRRLLKAVEPISVPKTVVQKRKP